LGSLKSSQWHNSICHQRSPLPNQLLPPSFQTSSKACIPPSNAVHHRFAAAMARLMAAKLTQLHHASLFVGVYYNSF
jgi:hypothetical protein